MTRLMMQPETRLRPAASICIPPTIADDARAVAAEQVHPAWNRLEQRGRHFVLRTTELEDISELADWARAALVEPEKPLTKARRQAYQAVMTRAARWAVIEPIGHCHCLATKWRETRLRHGPIARADGSFISSANDA
jgi:hypothetical protein